MAFEILLPACVEKVPKADEGVDEGVDDLVGCVLYRASSRALPRLLYCLTFPGVLP